MGIRMPEPNPTRPTPTRRTDGDHELALFETINDMGHKIRNDTESNWHFSIEAPRWATRSPMGNATTSVVASMVAILMAGLAFWLAWHATNKLTTAKPALTVQIGPWAAAGALLAAAGVAAYAATGSSRLRLRMTQLAAGETGARALAASGLDQTPDGRPAGPSSAARYIEIASDHAAAADHHALKAAGAANGVPDAAPAVASAEASAGSAHAAAAGAAAAGGSGTAGSTVGASDSASTISPKVWAGSIAGAVSVTFWTIAAATFWKDTFSSEALAVLVGSTTAIASAVAAYLRTDPMRVRARPEAG
jgi:hypothetical protein